MIFVYILIIVMAFTLVGGIIFETLKNDFLEAEMDKMIMNAQEINDWMTANYDSESLRMPISASRWYKRL